jgi:hypothetical protein
VLKNTSTHSFASASPIIRPPIAKTFASLCWRHSRARDIMRKRATDMRMAVGGDRNADARSADQNAASGLDGIGQLAGEIGIADGIGAICAQIQPLHASLSWGCCSLQACPQLFSLQANEGDAPAKAKTRRTAPRLAICRSRTLRMMWVAFTASVKMAAGSGAAAVR